MPELGDIDIGGTLQATNARMAMVVEDSIEQLREGKAAILLYM